MQLRGVTFDFAPNDHLTLPALTHLSFADTQNLRPDSSRSRHLFQVITAPNLTHLANRNQVASNLYVQYPRGFHLIAPTLCVVAVCKANSPLTWVLTLPHQSLVNLDTLIVLFPLSPNFGHTSSQALPLLGAVKRGVSATPLATINFLAKPVGKARMDALQEASCQRVPGVLTVGLVRVPRLVQPSDVHLREQVLDVAAALAEALVIVCAAVPGIQVEYV